MAITAAMVKELREMTGAGMMDCKKALSETNGDMDAAVEFLRKNGQAKAEKKAGRIAAEGLVRVAMDGDKKAAIVEVNSETDFVAKNETFQAYVEAVAAQAVKSDAADMDAFMAEAWIEDSSKTVKEALTNIAMQVAALSPKYVSSADVSEEYKEHEKSILLAQAKNENPDKPDNIIEKMIIGRLNKELKEVCLMEQVYVKAEDGKQSVAKYLDQVSKEVGSPVKVTGFVRFETGEGIEKKEENFAEEVAKQMAGN